MPESLSFDRVADRYDATRIHPSEASKQIAAGLLRVGGLQSGAEVLEIGIGTGRIALPLLAMGVNVMGIDIAPRMLEQLETKYAVWQAESGGSKGRLAVQIADMTALPFADATFDAVIAVHVLHLVPEWRQALGEALRVLRPGAALLLGQDIAAPGSMNHDIQDHWAQIARELGAHLQRVGARTFAEIVGELRARRLIVTESILASWDHVSIPREILDYVESRTWSQTWNIPDDIFAESMRRLRAWAESSYGDTIDTPFTTRLSFKVAVARTESAISV
jgi:ubiquinone/menaquinone biosynthesis C-methylase UbiE